jgi:hypothetical protein
MFPTLSTQLTEADKSALRTYISELQSNWVESLSPQPNEFGLRHLPRDPVTGKFLTKFKTDEHTYTVIGGDGIGLERYTYFQKRSVQMGFARNFQAMRDELQAIFVQLGTEASKSNAIVRIKGLLDSVVDFGNEQYDAVIWLCTLFILREDELANEYNEEIAQEKIEDWKKYGFSELDFFLLSGTVVPGYGKAFNDTIKDSQTAVKKFMDAIGTNGQESAPQG